MPPKDEIRKQVFKKLGHPQIKNDESKGRQLDDPNQAHDDWELQERLAGVNAWWQLPDPEASQKDWPLFMWMWARRVRRDILLIEEYLKAKYPNDPDIPFFGDPGDPPPPPDSFS